MPLFCAENWPRKVQSVFTKSNLEPSPSLSCIYPDSKINEYKDSSLQKNVKWRHKFVVTLLICHCGLQIFLPYSHFITKGFNNWTNGLYGYSWDMMVHSWDTILVVVKVVDNNSRKEFFIDSEAWTQNDRWNKHADMCVQYAQCLKKNLLQDLKKETQISPYTKDFSNHITSENISIYVDVWCSLNKRFQQRMYDPNYDLLQANWSPFRSVEWLLPVLTELNDFRMTMNEIIEEVYSWSNQSDVLFIADFPGLFLENFIDKDLQNVTLTVLEGAVVYEIEDRDTFQSLGVTLKKGESVPIEVGLFHKIHTISEVPSCYMYTFIREEKVDVKPAENKRVMYSPFPLVEDVQDRLESFVRMWCHIGNSILYILFGKPYHLRPKIKSDK
ncbi:hypothetical protein NQ314_000860 [Rhamnusium bicolor]|uniref:Vitamin K-dependent gamma-carboxylase lumenal domain-containing protein n=1 Tax=Rhamnusium bicolor TaxID=1586634 RepID=A0AAV8ZU32_9CUCU|nr:hypothetical protein NQ314_000860 [Rhamnusium bicolor]